MMSPGKLKANAKGVSFTGFQTHHELLKPDGKWYQNGAQNPFYNFRDPFTFKDPANPGKTYMVFEGNTATVRGTPACTAEDLGYRPGDPYAEDLETVRNSNARLQMANVGLAVATNDDLSSWKFLPPILSANCVTDQTERPQIYMKDGKYYLFTISHRSTVRRGDRRARRRLRVRRQRHPQRLPARQPRVRTGGRQPDQPQLRHGVPVRPGLQPAPGDLPGLLPLRDARWAGAVVHRHRRHQGQLPTGWHARSDDQAEHRR